MLTKIMFDLPSRALLFLDGWESAFMGSWKATFKASAELIEF